MSVELRSFPAASVEQIVALWNLALPRDPITTRRFTNLFLLDPNFDAAGVKVAVDGDRLAGAMYGVRRLVPLHGSDLEPEQGWIGFFFVHPEFRRQGIGSRLMQATLAWLKRPVVSFSPTTPNYFLPGLDAAEYPAAAGFLAGHGFSLQYEAVAMDRTLFDYRVPVPARTAITSLECRGYRFGTPGFDDLADLIPLARDQFNPDWGGRSAKPYPPECPSTASSWPGIRRVLWSAGRCTGRTRESSNASARSVSGPNAGAPALGGPCCI